MRRDRLTKKLEEIRAALLRSHTLDGMVVQKVVGEEHTVFVLEER